MEQLRQGSLEITLLPLCSVMNAIVQITGFPLTISTLLLDFLVITDQMLPATTATQAIVKYQPGQRQPISPIVPAVMLMTLKLGHIKSTKILMPSTT